MPLSSLPLPSFDLLNLPRPAASAPWSYIKVAEGCDRNCGFCAIPSFRGKQRSRTTASILAEVDQLAGPEGTLREVVLVAQDLSSFGLDRSGPGGREPIATARRPRRPDPRLVSAPRRANPPPLPRTRLGSTDALVEAMLATGGPYFDLSLPARLTPAARPHASMG